MVGLLTDIIRDIISCYEQALQEDRILNETL